MNKDALIGVLFSIGFSGIATLLGLFHVQDEDTRAAIVSLGVGCLCLGLAVLIQGFKGRG